MPTERSIAWIFQQEPKASAPQGEPKPTERRDTGTAGTQQPDPGQQPKSGPTQDPCGGNLMFYMLPALLLVWLFTMQSSKKQTKQRQALLNAIKKGDRVVTTGGMHGEVASITDQLVVLKVDTVKVTLDRSAIARVVKDDVKPETDDKGRDQARKG
jgi:preprotein translocase subunit YajC